MSISRALFSALSILLLSANGKPMAPGLAEGSAAPPFALAGPPAATAMTGAPSLIVFLDFSEGELGARPDDGPSRSEAEAIRTVVSAHGPSVLRAVLVDAAPTLQRRTPAVEDLLARVQAWGVERLPVVQDHESAGLARRYGVSGIPCVFLVDGQGIVRGRWDRFVPASELGARIDALSADRGPTSGPPGG